MNQRQKLAPIGNGDSNAATKVQLSRPDPPEGSEANWDAIARFSVIGIAVAVAVTALYFGRSFFMPVFAATMIGITLNPIQKYAAEHGIPPIVTAVLLVVLFFSTLWIGVSLVMGPATDWIARAPELGETIKEKLRYLERPMAAVRQLITAMGGTVEGSGQKVSVETSLAELVQQTIGILQPAFTEFIVFFGTLLFFLVGINRLRRQLIVYFGTREGRLRMVRIWNDIEDNLIAYLGVVTVINVGLGVATGLMLYLIGFPSPIAFGVLAFVLNYVPYIGPAILALVLFVIGFLTFPALGDALLAPAIFIGFNILEGYFITPSMVGKRLTLSPFLVFLALAFWTWLWGPLGAFLSTPLLIVGLVVLGHLFPRDELELPK
ncbi:MAG TPA: AI-2E family transporter [Xanthobacteraceae bacterium]|nr:AI-2E family transporter [Xanthobacteraceae bacterium]